MLYNRILITGANGLVGQQLVSIMGRMPEYDVLATGRDRAPRFSGGSCGYTQLDITDSAAIDRLFLDFTPDVVINCAAMTQVDLCEIQKEECWQINALAVELIARACRSAGASLIQLSTDFVFDGEEGPYRENARPNPINYYGRSKLAGENYARGAGMDKWAIVRTVLVYGISENSPRQNFVTWLRDKLIAGNDVQIVTDQWRTPTYAPDLAEGIERIIRYQKQGVFHVSGRDNIPIYEFALLIADAFGTDPKMIAPTDSSAFSQTAARPPRSGFIILKAETELGFKPRGIRSALEEMENLFEKHTSTD